MAVTRPRLRLPGLALPTSNHMHRPSPELDHPQLAILLSDRVAVERVRTRAVSAVKGYDFGLESEDLVGAFSVTPSTYARLRRC